MSGTKILWRQVIVTGLIVLLAIWGATERRPGGLPTNRSSVHLVRTVGLENLLPPIFIWRRFVYDSYAPQVFVEGAFIAASSAFISNAVAIGLSVWRARKA